MIEGAHLFAGEAGVSNVEFRVGDAMVEPFEPSHDGAYSRFGVMFFADAVRGFSNIRKGLIPEGRLAFACWQTPTKNGWASRPLEIIGRYADLPFGSDPNAPGPFSLSDPDRIHEALGAAGFDSVSVESRASDIKIGSDPADAADFMFQLMPPAAGLRTSDPESAAAVEAAMIDEFSDWKRDGAVWAPSAAWIVTARRSR